MYILKKILHFIYKNSYLGIIILPLIFPYILISEELSGAVIGIIGIIYLVFNKKSFKIDNIYFLLICILILLGIISCIHTNNLTKSLNGLSTYFDFAIYYFIIARNIEASEKLNKTATYAITIVAFISILFQGIIKDYRIYGNVGYANTYALILLAGLYLNETTVNEKFSSIIQVILSLGILYTGSRNTFFYFGIYVLIKLFFEFKKREGKRIYIFIVNLFLSISLYLVLETRQLGLIVVLPLIFYIVYELTKKLNYRTKNKLSILLVIVIVISIVTFKTNSFDRMKNTSPNAGVLQERFVYFEDSLKHILNNSLGSGINSFEYRQYFDQSAFYDVKYIHNSILQITYDLGVLGGITFLALFFYGLILIFKRKDMNKLWYIALYLTVFLHSLLDFDFSYPGVFCLILIIILNNLPVDVYEYEEEIKINIKHISMLKYMLYSVSIIFFIYLNFVNSIYFIGDTYTINKNYSEGRKFYNINSKITFKDPELYSRIAENYSLESKLNNDSSEIQQCIGNLKKAEKINPYDPRIIGNIAFTYERLNSSHEAIEYYDKFLISQHYDSEIYSYYYAYLNKLYVETKDDKYKNKINALLDKYLYWKEQLNPKSRFMLNQLDKLS